MDRLEITDFLKAATLCVGSLAGSGVVWSTMQTAIGVIITLLNLTVAIYSIKWLRKKIHTADLEAEERLIDLNIKRRTQLKINEPDEPNEPNEQDR